MEYGDGNRPNIAGSLIIVFCENKENAIGANYLRAKIVPNLYVLVSYIRIIL